MNKIDIIAIEIKAQEYMREKIVVKSIALSADEIKSLRVFVKGHEHEHES